MAYLISGRVVEIESRKGIGGLVVKAVDKDLLFDDLLGSAVTDVNGQFEITYEEEDFKELIEKHPDIVIVVKTSDRSRTLYQSSTPARFPKGGKAHFEIEIPSRLLNATAANKEENMGKGESIGKITLEINPEQLKKIVSSGRLGVFIETATTLFNRDLKSGLVEASASSLSTGLFAFDDDEYGTGPRPPHWWNIGKIDQIAKRLDLIEKAIGINEDLLEGSLLDKTRGV